MSASSFETSEARASKRLAICVFGGVESGQDTGTQRLAGELGAHIAGRGHLLVYGAGGSGLMGAVARGASRSGGPIMGVLPAFLHEREHAAEAPVQTLMLTRDHTDRKLRMMASADAFIALPGGYGTLDGILEVATRAQLGLHRKPLVLLDSGGFWEQFRDLISGIHKRGFVVADTPPFELACTVQEALTMIEDKVTT